MNRFEVTVRWTLRAAFAQDAHVEAEILAKQSNHPRHGVDGGEVVAITPLRDRPPAVAAAPGAR